jgi:hypothetical protein
MIGIILNAKYYLRKVWKNKYEGKPTMKKLVTKVLKNINRPKVVSPISEGVKSQGRI